MTARNILDLLPAAGPFADDAGRLMTYGWLVGSWDVDAIWFDEGGGQREMKGKWHFAWILGGRAMQDVLFGANMRFLEQEMRGRRRPADPHDTRS